MAETTFDFNQRISLGLTGKVGKRLSVNANYDTQSTFSFQNLIKIAYDPTYSASDDAIIQNIEVGNVSMPLNSTLIRGAQSLFGVKTKLQFGKTTVTGVFSEQKSKTKSVVAEGGGTVQNFDIFALEKTDGRTLKTVVYYVVEVDGSILYVKAIGENESFNKEAERALKSIKTKYAPAKVNNLVVRHILRMPLSMNFK